MNRSEVGWREFGRASAGSGPVATERVRRASPALADGVGEFIFADIFSRPGMTARERELVTVAVLCALGGAEPQLGLHIPAALECGMDPDELVAMCEQLSPYAGFPRALNALRAVRGVLEERGLPLPLPAARVPLGAGETLLTQTGEGEGPAIVLLHAPAFDRLVWRDVLRTVSARRVLLAPDLHGHGFAGGHDGADRATVAADVAELVGSHLPAGALEVVTLGAAAAVGADLAAMFGGRVTALTHVSPGTTVPEPGETRVLARWLRADTLAVDGAGVRYARDRVHRCHPPAWEGWAGNDPAHVPVPTTVVVGDLDPDAASAAGLAERLGASLRRVDGAGQLLPVDAPSALSQVLAPEG